jgi:hypothetical protein
MPSREVNARRREKEEKAKEKMIYIHLKPFSKYFAVPMAQLLLIQFFAARPLETSFAIYTAAFAQELTPWLEVFLASLSTDASWIGIEGFHPAIFTIFVQWLHQDTLWPFQDYSMPLSDSRSAALPRTSIAFINGIDITLTTLFDTTSDMNPDVMAPTRKLIHAYFMGQHFGAHYFQDCIMNLIIRHLRVNQRLQPNFVHEIYIRSNIGVQGLKKLLVDVYTWTAQVDISQVLPLGYGHYPAAFERDVNATLSNIRTHKYPIDTQNPANPKNKVFVDVVVDFSRLEASLVQDLHGSLKCRYHHHGTTKPCFHMVMDNTRVGK